MLKFFPGISVGPHQCDDAEQHRRCAKDNPPIQRRLHTEKATPSLLRACGTSEVISALCFCSVSEKRGMHEFAYLRWAACALSVDLLLLPPASIVSGIFT